MLRENNKKTKFAISVAELLKMKIDEQPCLLDPILPQVGLVAIAGSSETGKSTLMRQLGIELVSGKERFLGYKINARHKKALYVSTEDGQTQITSLLRKQNIYYKLPEDELAGLSYIFDFSNLHKELDKWLTNEPNDFIVLDAFADLYTNDLNQANQVRAYMNEYHLLAEKHQCLFIFVHHTNKSSENKAPSKTNLLGSQGFEAKVRTVLYLQKDKVKPNIRHFCLVKGNYLPEELKNEAIELRFDENLIFTPTGNTELLENLSKDPERKYREEEVIRLNDSGKSQNEIADELGISQSTVSRYLNVN